MDAATTTLIGSLGALIAEAQTEMAAPKQTPAAITGLQAIVTHAQAVIATLNVIAAGTPSYAVVVQDGPLGPESIFEIAERELGSLTLFPSILKLNSLAFIALDAGQTLLIPKQ